MVVDVNSKVPKTRGRHPTPPPKVHRVRLLTFSNCRAVEVCDSVNF